VVGHKHFRALAFQASLSQEPADGAHLRSSDLDSVPRGANAAHQVEDDLLNTRFTPPLVVPRRTTAYDPKTWYEVAAVDRDFDWAIAGFIPKRKTNWGGISDPASPIPAVDQTSGSCSNDGLVPLKHSGRPTAFKQKTPFEHAQHDVPILKWLANYKVGQDLKFDLVAGSPWP